MSDHTVDQKKSIHDPRYKRLIQSLADRRRKCGVSQSRIAELLNLSQSDISKIETCERRIDFIETLDWLFALGLSPVVALPEILRELEGSIER